MEDFIKTLLSNFMFICIPPIIYFLYLTNSEKRADKFPPALMLLYLGCSIILCMSFPFRYLGIYNLDFRQIPLVLGVLYGGRHLGGILLLILLGYRYMLGGEGFYSGLFISLAVYFSLVFIKSKYKLDSRYKIIYAVLISAAVVAIPVVFTLVLVKLITLQVAIFILLFRIVQTLAICLTVYGIEFVIDHFNLQRKLQESEKMRVVSEIAASVSHEIRNPLTTVKGMLQLMGEKNLPRERQQEFIRLALDEIDAANNIISDFLTFSKPQLDNIRLIHLADECKQVVNILTPYANMHQVRLSCTVDPSCTIMGDSQKLRQSLINLVKNCIEASAKGKVEISLFKKKENVVVHIKDTGIGMTKEQIKRLGTPYYSTKEKGTGLGTMVAFSLIQAMNGSITVENEIEKGSLFILSFPSPVVNHV